MSNKSLKTKFKHIQKVLTITLLCTGLGACAVSFPYKIDVPQGNFISKENLDSIKVGMSREQVFDALGTPLLVDLFHANRIDYVFTLKRQSLTTSVPVRYTVTLYFNKADALEKIDNSNLPPEQSFINTLAGDIGV